MYIYVCMDVCGINNTTQPINNPVEPLTPYSPTYLPTYLDAIIPAMIGFKLRETNPDFDMSCPLQKPLIQGPDILGLAFFDLEINI